MSENEKQIGKEIAEALVNVDLMLCNAADDQKGPRLIQIALTPTMAFSLVAALQTLLQLDPPPDALQETLMQEILNRLRFVIGEANLQMTAEAREGIEQIRKRLDEIAGPARALERRGIVIASADAIPPDRKDLH